jgi:hypothetical protein
MILNLVLRFYRLSPKYDLYMAKIFNIFIMFAMIIHYCFGIWIYGNPNLFYDSNDSSFAFIKDLLLKYITSDNAFVNNLIYRLILSHNIVCLFFLGLMLLVFMFRITLYSFIQIVCRKSKIKSNTNNTDIGLGIILLTHSYTH